MKKTLKCLVCLFLAIYCIGVTNTRAAETNDEMPIAIINFYDSFKTSEKIKVYDGNLDVTDVFFEKMGAYLDNGDFYKVDAYVKSNDLMIDVYENIENIDTRAYEQKIKKVEINRYTNGVKEQTTNFYWGYYIVNITYGFTYNPNTYMIGNVVHPRIEMTYSSINTTLPNLMMLRNITNYGEVSSDKMSVNFVWSFEVWGRISGKDYFFKTESKTERLWP